jgi:hypothetical protein
MGTLGPPTSNEIAVNKAFSFTRSCFNCHHAISKSRNDIDRMNRLARVDTTGIVRMSDVQLKSVLFPWWSITCQLLPSTEVSTTHHLGQLPPRH